MCIDSRLGQIGEQFTVAGEPRSIMVQSETQPCWFRELRVKYGLTVESTVPSAICVLLLARFCLFEEYLPVGGFR